MGEHIDHFQVLRLIDQVLLEEEDRLAELKRFSQSTDTFETAARDNHLEAVNKIGEIALGTEPDNTLL